MIALLGNHKLKLIRMEDYFTFTHLIGVRDANLSPYRDARVQRYKSVRKMMDLIQIAQKTMPALPLQVFQLNEFDRTFLFIQPNGMILCLSPLSTTHAMFSLASISPPFWYFFIYIVFLWIQLQRHHLKHPLQNFPQFLPLLGRYTCQLWIL